jgi:predicted lipid carrier protein YhbT
MLRPRPSATTAHNDGDGGKEAMATAEECRAALESLTGRIAEMDAKDRAAHLLDRTLSCRVPDLGLTFLTRLSPNGAEPIRQVGGGAPPAQVRFTADSDVIVAIAADPGSFMRAWLTGRLKVQGSVFDLLHLRKLM